MSDTTALSTQETEMESVQFPKYDRYKDSGAEWLGEVPEHWNVSTIRAVTELKSDKNQPDLPVLSVYREYGVILKDSRDDNHNATSLDTSTYKAVKEGDLVVNKMKAWQGSMGVSEHEGIVSPAYITCRVKQEKMLPKYLHYLLRSKPFIGVYNAISYGVRVGQWDMRYEDFKKVLIVEPPAKEMTRIVSFIDEKTAEIDAAIVKKQALIQLLNEQKAILINRAVTKGLNPNVRMKDSGVAWIGEIPEHWKVVRLKHFSNVQTGITLGKTYSGKGIKEYPYLRVANVQDGYFKLDELTTIRLPTHEAKKYLIQSGDIMVTEGGDIDKLGRGTVWRAEREECLHQNHVFCVRVDKTRASESFIALVSGCDYGRRYFTNTANKTTNLASTNRTKLGNLPVALPPKQEQLKITSYAAEISKEYSVILETINRELESLIEFKQTLITYATTGKIKV